MQLTTENLAYLKDCAVKAALQAGEIISASKDLTFDVKTKPGGDSLASQVVTEVDLQSEKLIVAALQTTCEQFDLGLLTEERGDDGSRLVKDNFWCIDPIDGTLSFIEGVPGYAVSIGLVSKAGEALVGVVYDPVSSVLYSAVHGQGAWRNGQPWKMANDEFLSEKTLTLVCDRSLEARPFYPDLLKWFESYSSRIGASGLRILHNGGAVINGCWVLENVPACYFKLPKTQQGGGSLWDFAAITCLFNEVGAIATDFNGQPLNLNLAETTFMNNKGVIFSTNKHLAEAIQQIIFE